MFVERLFDRTIESEQPPAAFAPVDIALGKHGADADQRAVPAILR